MEVTCWRFSLHLTYSRHTAYSISGPLVVSVFTVGPMTWWHRSVTVCAGGCSVGVVWLMRCYLPLYMQLRGIDNRWCLMRVGGRSPHLICVKREGHVQFHSNKVKKWNCFARNKCEEKYSALTLSHWAPWQWEKTTSTVCCPWMQSRLCSRTYSTRSCSCTIWD